MAERLQQRNTKRAPSKESRTWYKKELKTEIVDLYNGASGAKVVGFQSFFQAPHATDARRTTL